MKINKLQSEDTDKAAKHFKHEVEINIKKYVKRHITSTINLDYIKKFLKESTSTSS